MIVDLDLGYLKENLKIIQEAYLFIYYHLQFAFVFKQIKHNWMVYQHVENHLASIFVKLHQTMFGYSSEWFVMLFVLMVSVLHDRKEQKIFETQTILKVLVPSVFQDMGDWFTVEFNLSSNPNYLILFEAFYLKRAKKR